MPVSFPPVPGIPAISVSQFGAVGDGSHDDTGAFAAAAAAAIASNGQLLIGSPQPGKAFHVASLITLVTPDAAHNSLSIIFDPNAVVEFNATAGFLKFDGTGAGGRFNYPTVKGNGAIVRPYASQANGLGWAFWFHECNRIDCGDLTLEYLQGVVANGIFADNCFTGDFHDLEIDGPANGVVWGNTSNEITIRDGEIGGTTVLAAGSIGGTGVNNDNVIENLYLELNTGIVVAFAPNDVDCRALANYHNNNTAAAEVMLDGSDNVCDLSMFSLPAGTDVIKVNATAVGAQIKRPVFNPSVAVSGSGVNIRSGATGTIVDDPMFRGGTYGTAMVTDAGTGTIYRPTTARIVTGTGAQAIGLYDGTITWNPGTPANATFTLPSGVWPGKRYGLKHYQYAGTHFTLSLAAPGGQTLDGAASQSVPYGGYAEAEYQGSNFWILR